MGNDENEFITEESVHALGLGRSILGVNHQKTIKLSGSGATPTLLPKKAFSL